MKLILLTCLVIFSIATPCVAQQTPAAKIDRVIKQQMDANKIPGVSLAVLRSGKIVLLKSYGLANVEHQVPVKPDTIFQWETRDFKLARALAATFYPDLALPDVKTIADTEPQTTALIRRALMQVVIGKDDRKEIAQSLNAFSLPAAIIHSSELIERKTEKNLRVNRYLLTDIDRSLSCEVKLTPDDKIASIKLVELKPPIRP